MRLAVMQLAKRFPPLARWWVVGSLLFSPFLGPSESPTLLAARGALGSGVLATSIATLGSLALPQTAHASSPIVVGNVYDWGRNNSS